MMNKAEITECQKVMEKLRGNYMKTRLHYYTMSTGTLAELIFEAANGIERSCEYCCYDGLGHDNCPYNKKPITAMTEENYFRCMQGIEVWLQQEKE